MYLDNAASTRIIKEVQNKMNEVIKVFGNPSSLHERGVLSKKYIQEATEIIANKLNCNSHNIHYTSGATMSNNMVIQGFLRHYPTGKVYVSAVEHNDIMEMQRYFSDRIEILPVNPYGIVIIEDVIKVLKDANENPILLSIQMANSETGVLQPMCVLSDIIKDFKNVYLHTDATQYIPHYSIDLSKYNISALSMSGQKIGCVKGTGLLYLDDKLKIDPIIFGEQGLVGGTENVQGIACLGEAFRVLQYDKKYERVYLEAKFKELGIRIVGNEVGRLPNITCALFDDCQGESMAILLNEHNIYCSSGSACSSGNPDPSHVLKAIGLSDDEANSAVRFSLSEEIMKSDVDDLIEQLIKIKEILGK